MAALFALGGVALLALAVIDGTVLGYLFFVAFAVAAWWSWPGRRGRHRPHHEALATAGDDDIIVYWRPG